MELTGYVLFMTIFLLVFGWERLRSISSRLSMYIENRQRTSSHERTVNRGLSSPRFSVELIVMWLSIAGLCVLIWLTGILMIIAKTALIVTSAVTIWLTVGLFWFTLRR